MYDKVCQKRRRCAPPFLDNLEKTGGGGFSTTPPSMAKVKLKTNVDISGLCLTWQIEELQKDLDQMQMNHQELQKSRDTLEDEKQYLSSEMDKLRTALNEW